MNVYEAIRTRRSVRRYSPRPIPESTLPRLRACRQLLIAIPSSLEEQPRVVDLIRDETALGQLRRVHDAIGNALRDERIARDVASLDPEPS